MPCSGCSALHRVNPNKVYNKSLSKLKVHSLLEHREDFWILKLQTLSLQGLNISLNYPQDTTGSIW